MKVFWIFLLFVMLEIGLIIVLDFLQPMPRDYALNVLKLPYYMLGRQEKFLILVLITGIILNYMRNKRSKKVG